ncbi:PepSY domain-containing protein [Shewanella mesophila]|uniref:PepSY domain-containing protein n=1 Tax=Shewanella mesophila TaxID=2864208 RepID=UPI0021ACCAA5|nr:hypothetical protein [Shewanella mesophila]
MKPIYTVSALMLSLISVSSIQALPLIELEHNQAKQLVSEGKIVSLDFALTHMERYCSGKLLDAHLYQTQGEWHYDLQIRSDSGEMISLSIDATTGKPQQYTQLPIACRIDKK